MLNIFKLNHKTPGFLLSTETLLAAAAFSITCALTLNLVWSGIFRMRDSKQQLAVVDFIKNKTYESDFAQTKNEVFVKKYEELNPPQALQVTRERCDKRSELAATGLVLKKFVFSKKAAALEDVEGEPRLVGFFPYFIQED
jgi:hypothetical protein